MPLVGAYVWAWFDEGQAISAESFVDGWFVIGPFAEGTAVELVANWNHRSHHNSTIVPGKEPLAVRAWRRLRQPSFETNRRQFRIQGKPSQMNWIASSRAATRKSPTSGFNRRVIWHSRYEIY